MTSNWYFGRDLLKNGPYTAKQMQGLAASGALRPTDTVWKEGVARGVVATRVEHLFVDTPASQPPDATGAVVTVPIPAPFPFSSPLSTTEPLSPAESLPEDATLAPLQEATAAETPAVSPENKSEEAPVKKPVPKQEVRKRRVVTIKGGILVSQDGITVRFRKSCVRCNQPDTSVACIPIPLGNSRTTYFCRQCRKCQPVEIQGAY